MTEKREPSQVQIEAAARMLCYLNGIAECADSGCTPDNCPYGMRDFGGTALEVARAVINASNGEEEAK